MNTTKYNLSAGVNFQGNQVMNIDLGTFDTIEEAREAANKHIKTIYMEFDAEIVYDILEIINYGTDEEYGKTILSISLTIDKETCKNIIDTTLLYINEEKYKKFTIKSQKEDTAYELNTYGKGINAKTTLDFIKSIIDNIENKTVSFDTFKVFFSGYQGFEVCDGETRKANIMYDGPWHTLEDWGPGKGWYIEIGNKDYYGFDEIINQLLKLK